VKSFNTIKIDIDTNKINSNSNIEINHDKTSLKIDNGADNTRMERMENKMDALKQGFGDPKLAQTINENKQLKMELESIRNNESLNVANYQKCIDDLKAEKIEMKKYYETELNNATTRCAKDLEKQDEMFHSKHNQIIQEISKIKQIVNVLTNEKERLVNLLQHEKAKNNELAVKINESSKKTEAKM
jgi:hypothetical protein